MNDVKFDFDDILIEPSDMSKIKSRYEDVRLKYEDGFLPIFTAPMRDVVYDKPEIFLKNNINVALSRRQGDISINDFSKTSPNLFYSIDLKDFIKYFIDNSDLLIEKFDKKTKFYILIDVANGNMNNLINSIKKVKKIFKDKIVIMSGNAANPETYRLLSDAGSSYVRLGVGNGSACLTTENTAIGYPMASLIKETYELSCTLKNPAKIIADGGMKKYSDIIKALSLGADYVMLGGIFNKCLESEGETYTRNIFGFKYKIKDPTIDYHVNKFKNGKKYWKKFRGMSSKSIQKDYGNNIIKTSEGIEKYNIVNTTVSSWVENMDHYLRSALSYCNCEDLNDFKGKVKYNFITDKAFKRFNK